MELHFRTVHLEAAQPGPAPVDPVFQVHVPNPVAVAAHEVVVVVGIHLVPHGAARQFECADEPAATSAWTLRYTVALDIDGSTRRTRRTNASAVGWPVVAPSTRRTSRCGVRRGWRVAHASRS